MLFCIAHGLDCLLGRRVAPKRYEKDWRRGCIIFEFEEPLQGGAWKESKMFRASKYHG